MIRSRKVLDTAKGAECAVQFPGICQGGTETTVWCHLNSVAFGKGMGVKAHDILGFHGCLYCHAYTDHGHYTHPVMSDADYWRYILEAVCKTIVRVVETGVMFVPMDAPKEHKPAVRKPKDQRKAIPSPKDHKWPSRTMGKRKEGK